MKYLSLTMLILTLAAGLGCEPYVNIPGQAGDVAQNDPNSKSPRETMAVAVSEVAKMLPRQGVYRVLLPAGSSYATYSFVINAASEYQRIEPIRDVQSASPAITVAQVRTRGMFGEVDVISPFPPLRPDGEPQLITIEMKFTASGNWEVTQVFPWELDVEQALRESRGEFNTESPAHDPQDPGHDEIMPGQEGM